MYDRAVVADKFQAQTWPNARLAGLLVRDEEDVRRLVPLLFAEVRPPKVVPDKTPRLSSRVPARQWVFSWDSRRGCGYLLVLPPRGQTEIRFDITWDG